jgi:hypothetical protein
MGSVELWYDSVLVGRVHDATDVAGTWSGVIEFAIDRTAPQAAELLAYIDFCVDWNDAQDTDHPPPASQFDAYAFIVKSGLWFARVGDVRHPIEDAALFFGPNEVSWRLARP